MKESFEQQVAAARRRVLWLWAAFAGWLLVLTWLAHRLGAL